MTRRERRIRKERRRAYILGLLLLSGLMYAALAQLSAAEFTLPPITGHDLARERAAFNYYPPEAQ